MDMKVHTGDYENFDEEELHPEIEINLDRMNDASNSINRLERQLSKEESRHKNFVIDFAAKLEKSKKNLSEKEIKNSEQFYLIMRRGEQLSIIKGIVTVLSSLPRVMWSFEPLKTGVLPNWVIKSI